MSYTGTSDFETALQNVITTIIDALIALFSGFAQWLQQNAGLIANILGRVQQNAGITANIIGYMMLSKFVVDIIAYFGRRMYDFFRDFFGF